MPHLEWLIAAEKEVARDVHALHVESPELPQHDFERREISVHVGEKCDWTDCRWVCHGGEPSIDACMEAGSVYSHAGRVS